MTPFFAPSQISAGFVSVLIGFTGAAAIIFQAAATAGASAEQISSWMWALGMGMGFCGIGLTLYYRQPVMIAWSTPGAALLISSLEGVALGQAIGAFLLSSGLILLCGLTGWFDRIMAMVPKSLAAGLLGGVLLKFGLNVFPAMQSEFLLVGGMLITYLAGRQFFPRYGVPATFFIGVAIAALQGDIAQVSEPLRFTLPVFMAPEFEPSVLIGVGIPLFVVTMASQNVPGIAVMRAHGYDAPASPIISWTGISGLILAPFGGFALNLAAITAAICMGRDVHDDPAKRYPAALWAGFFHILTGTFGATVAALFAAFPQQLVTAIAGLALLGTISNSLGTALKADQEGEREAAFLTFAITASGVTFFGIGSAFWGLLAGMTAFALWRQAQARAAA